MRGEFILNNNMSYEGRKILLIPIEQVVPGYVTAHDIYSKNEQLVLAKNVKLEPNMIAKIMFYAVESIYVYEPEEEQNNQKSYYEKIQESEEFSNFLSTYKEALEQIKEHFHRTVVLKEEMDETALLQEVKKVLEKGRHRYHLFELLSCVNEHDNMTLVHSINVASICSMFGQWLHMSENDIDILILCGLLHDTGKIMIPKEILTKPAKLTAEEFQIIKEHPLHGYRMLSEQKIDPRICLAALEHHERYDGVGYPYHKLGNEIHPYSMITAIADVFDAMTSKRVYRDAICPFSVLEMFENEGKIQYDLSVSMPLMERIAEIYINHTVQLSNQMKGEVIMLNRQNLSKPVVRVGQEFVDLSKHKDMKIETVM